MGRIMAIVRDHTSVEIIELLVNARAHGERPLLAFDADGTLWRGDVGCDVFAAAIERAGFREEARDPLVAHAALLGLDTTGSVAAIAERLFAAFHDGSWEDGPAAEGMALGFAGYTDEEALAFSSDVLASVALPKRLHAGIADIIAWARAHDLEVVVVSASPSAVVRAAVRALPIPPDRVIAMELEARADDRFSARLRGPSVYGAGKVTALDAYRAGRSVLGAFGDSYGDRFMLRSALVPVGVGASAKLLAEASSIDRFVLLPFPVDSA